MLGEMVITFCPAVGNVVTWSRRLLVVMSSRMLKSSVNVISFSNFLVSFFVNGTLNGNGNPFFLQRPPKVNSVERDSLNWKSIRLKLSWRDFLYSNRAPIWLVNCISKSINGAKDSEMVIL